MNLPLPAPLKEMWIGVPASPIEILLGRAEAEARLKNRLPGPFSGLTQEGLRGSVEGGKVAVWWNTPGFGNAWRPVLRGEIVGDEVACRIEGKFSTFRFSQVFCAVWFGFLAAFAVIGLL